MPDEAMLDFRMPAASVASRPAGRPGSAPQNAGGWFRVRIGAVILDGDRVILQRDLALNRPFWVLPGGRAEFGEQGRDTAVREVAEELGVRASVGRLVWVNENRFARGTETCHELGLYFLMRPEEPLTVTEESFTGPEGDRFEFRWHPVDALGSIELYPEFLRTALCSLPETPQHVVEWA